MGTLLLLLFFLISISPSFIVHHHHDEDIISYDKATQCEKAIYYGAELGSCHHKTHLTKIHSVCWLCQFYNNLNPQIVLDNRFNLIVLFSTIKIYPKLYYYVISLNFAAVFNKSPPLLLFLTNLLIFFNIYQRN